MCLYNCLCVFMYMYVFVSGLTNLTLQTSTVDISIDIVHVQCMSESGFEQKRRYVSTERAS